MANINIRINNDIKSKAENIFEMLGLTPTAAITLFYNQVIRTNSIPFELKVDIPNKTTVKAINEIEEIEKNPEKYKTFDDVDELMEDLLKWSIAFVKQVNSKKILKIA